MREIRPLGKALCLACLRLPVIIIKAVSQTAAAEQSSHLERRPVRRKIKKDRATGQRKMAILSLINSPGQIQKIKALQLRFYFGELLQNSMAFKERKTSRKYVLYCQTKRCNV